MGHGQLLTWAGARPELTAARAPSVGSPMTREADADYMEMTRKPLSESYLQVWAWRPARPTISVICAATSAFRDGHFRVTARTRASRSRSMAAVPVSVSHGSPGAARPTFKPKIREARRCTVHRRRAAAARPDDGLRLPLVGGRGSRHHGARIWGRQSQTHQTYATQPAPHGVRRPCAGTR